MISRRTILIGVPGLVAGTVAATSGLAPAVGAGGTPQTAAPDLALPAQSPIDIVRRDAEFSPWLPKLVTDYPDHVDLRVRYVSRDAGDPGGCATPGREETIEAEVPPGTASIRLGTTRYDLVQFHFHTPSEHVLDGHRFPVEQHFVHRGPRGELLVIGLFLQSGGPGRSLQDRVLATLPVECGEEIEIAGASLATALPRSLSTFRYSGSLTTSPTTEGVSWLVLAQPRRIARTTIDRLHAAFPQGDSRDLQPLNGRVVRLRTQR